MIPLVLIEAGKLEYTRYVGKLLTNQVKSDRLLLDVEMQEPGATVMSVVISATGDITILSPLDEVWTQQYLLNAGWLIPQRTVQ